jgi:hypothetical protein
MKIINAKNWFTCTDIAGLADKLLDPEIEDEYDRKWLLFGVACCRRLRQLIANEGLRKCVEVAEKFADGEITRDKFEAFREQIDDGRIEVAEGSGETLRLCGSAVWEHLMSRHPEYLCRTLVLAVKVGLNASDRHMAVRDEKAAQLGLLRDIFGNPSRLHAYVDDSFQPVTIEPSWLSVNNRAVHRIAEQIYEMQRFNDMPILADALEDAGCTNTDVLSHCRGPGPHVRGCWVLDLLLGWEMDGEWELPDAEDGD